MKKNLFSFIGSILGVVSIFLLGAPYLALEYSLIESTGTSVQEFIGIPIFQENIGVPDRYIQYPYLTICGLLLTVSLLCAFVALIIVLIGILKNKNVNGTALILSSVNAFTIFFIAKDLSIKTKIYNDLFYKCYIGWGIITILILFFAFFVLSLIGFILSNIYDKKVEKKNNFDDIYKFKKLLDEGIITKEEFEKKKKELIF